MKIIQLLTTINFGDAVSSDALAIRQLLSEMGYASEIYAENIDARLPAGTASKAENLPEMKRDDLLIYHLSTGTALNFKVDGYRCRKVMIYHNVTPPAYFAAYNPAAEKLCVEGLRGMVHLRNSFETVIADSAFNRQNLLDAGYTCPIHVLPILIPFEDYRQEPDPDTVRAYSDGRTNILFVGRIAPNKKQEDAIRAFDCYRKQWDPDARLILVGSDAGMENYGGRLQRYARELGAEQQVIFPGHISFRQILAFYKTAHLFVGRIAPNKKQEDAIRAFDCYRKQWDPEARLILVGSDAGMENYRGRLQRYARELGAEEQVIFPGHISFRQILAFYKTAHLFLCMSEHEGFCVPLAEAMSFDVPIVARSLCAVPETLGGAGVLLEDAAPETAAAAMRRVRTDEALRRQLTAQGRKRLADFSYETVGQGFREILAPYLPGRR